MPREDCECGRPLAHNPSRSGRGRRCVDEMCWRCRRLDGGAPWAQDVIAALREAGGSMLMSELRQVLGARSAKDSIGRQVFRAVRLLERSGRIHRRPIEAWDDEPTAWNRAGVNGAGIGMTSGGVAIESPSKLVELVGAP